MPNPSVEAEIKARANTEMSSQSDDDEEIKEDKRRQEEREKRLAEKMDKYEQEDCRESRLEDFKEDDELPRDSDELASIE